MGCVASSSGYIIRAGQVALCEHFVHAVHYVCDVIATDGT